MLNRNRKPRQKKRPQLHHALLTVGVMAAAMLTAVGILHTSPHIPLVFGCLAAGLTAWYLGSSWDEILEGMIGGITDSLEAVLILLMIGMVVGTWIAGGTVPTLICYGLKVISPSAFLPSAMLICALVACAIGSWGTVGTIGLAFMGIGTALQIPAPMICGAVISGAYMGEVISPLSDATNLAAAAAGENVFSVVKKTIPTALTGGIMAALMFAAAGMKFGGGQADAVQQTVGPLVESLRAQFHISPVTLIPLVVMAACILAKVPAIPSMLSGSLAGMATVLLVQKGSPASVFICASEGYTSTTGNEMLDTLLTAGGLQNMMEPVSIIILAMAFGGIMKESGQMDALVEPLVSRLHSIGGLSCLAVLSCVFLNVMLPDQYLAISLPGQMYGPAMKKRGIPGSMLGAMLLGGGAVTSPLVPWNTCGIYCRTLLGVSPAAYGRWTFYGLMLPVLFMIKGAISRKTRTRV